MDKIRTTPMLAPHRQGFALMITLSVLSVIIALTMVLLHYFEEVQQDASKTKALLQADVYYADIQTIFDGIKDKKALFSLLYRTALPIQDPDDKFSLVLECNALGKGVNINWLGMANNTQKAAQYAAAQDLFDFLIQEYEVGDPVRLMEMIFEEIDNKMVSSQNPKSRLHQNNGIISYQQFEALLSRYQFEVDDPTIGLVPWEKYFSFSPTQEKIDAQYSSPELLAYLFDMDVYSVKEWTTSLDIDRVPLDVFVEQNGGAYEKQKDIIAGDEFLDATHCSVQYAYAQGHYRFGFDYIQGEAKYFEFYGKQ